MTVRVRPAPPNNLRFEILGRLHGLTLIDSSSPSKQSFALLPTTLKEKSPMFVFKCRNFATA